MMMMKKKKMMMIVMVMVMDDDDDDHDDDDNCLEPVLQQNHEGCFSKQAIFGKIPRSCNDNYGLG
jgi:hypothetical protein